MFCQKCGKEIPDGSVACNFCGEAIKQSPEPIVPSQSVATPPPKKEEHGILFWGAAFIGIIFILIVSVAIVSAFVFGMSSGTASTTVPHTTLAATPTEDPRSATVKITASDGVVTADVTNVGRMDKSFILLINSYDGNVKLDSTILTTASIGPGETARATGILPYGTKRISLDNMAVMIGDKPYRIYYDVTYS